jgi:hypothetical protein
MLTPERDGPNEHTNKPNSKTVSPDVFIVLLMNTDVFWAMTLCRLVVTDVSRELIVSIVSVVPKGIP